MKLRNLGYLALSIVALVMGACTKSCQKAPKEVKEEAKEEVKEEPSVFFKSLKDGDVVTSPVKIEFGVKGMTVRPALEDMDDRKSGHHHLLINSKFVPEGQPIPADPTHLHYGQGETEATVELAPGVYTLTMQFGDGAHRSYGEKMAATITITVKASEGLDGAKTGEGVAQPE